MREADTMTAGTDEEHTVAVADKQFSKRRRRALWRRARRWVVGLLVVALLVGGGWLLYFSDYVTVQRVQVTGIQRVNPVRVRAAAAVPMGRQLVRVDLAAIQARVESIDAIRYADVSRSWPHGVRIAITERRPVAVVDRGTTLQAVDSTGVLFGSYGRRPPGMPLIRTKPGASTEELAEAGRIAASLPPAFARRVEHIQLDTVDRIELRLHDGRTVVWGSSAHSAQKVEVATVLLKRKAQVVDVSVPERPTTRG